MNRERLDFIESFPIGSKIKHADAAILKGGHLVVTGHGEFHFFGNVVRDGKILSDLRFPYSSKWKIFKPTKIVAPYHIWIEKKFKSSKETVALLFTEICFEDDKSFLEWTQCPLSSIRYDGLKIIKFLRITELSIEVPA